MRGLANMADVLENKIRAAINWTTVWMEDDAVPVVGEIFDHVVGVLKQTPQFKDTPRDQLDLLLADCRNQAEQDIGDIVDGTIRVEEAISDIVEGLTP
jgi:hypothetical protein